MNIEQRHKYILDELNHFGTVRIASISSELNISRETIRKDIYLLDKKGLVHAVRGGAIPLTTISETRYGQRQKLNAVEKTEIAQSALKLIDDGNTVFLDYGSTSFEVAEAIKHSNLTNLTIITNSATVLDSLRYSNHQFVLLGGTMRSSEGSFSGPLTLNNIDNLYADIGFFGSGGINLTIGVTNHYFGEVEVSKKMMAHCKLKAVLADHSKFGKTALYKTASIEQLDIVLTDKSTDQAIIQEIENLGVQVIFS